MCDGSLLNSTNYPELYNIIGTTFGTPDSSSSSDDEDSNSDEDVHEYYLPDLTSRYLQGSLTPGLYLDEGLPEIEGIFPIDDSVTYGTLSGAFTLGDKDYSRDWTSTGDTKGYHIHFNASSSNSIYGNSSSVRPLTLTTLYIIKYK